METENKKIETIITKYERTLKSLNMDIAHSKFSNQWYLFKYEPLHHNYEFFFKIKDASDLINAILSELAFEMHFEISDDDIDTPECEKNDLSDRIEYYRQRDCLPEVAASFEYIKNNTSLNNANLLETLNSLIHEQ